MFLKLSIHFIIFRLFCTEYLIQGLVALLLCGLMIYVIFTIEMKHQIQKILTQYWGYSVFRPLQEDIILSVMNGKDALALLPTGGGKSITFQVPALAMDGMCIVVTPLIALMKDQVENLKKRSIKAGAIHSGMSLAEIDVMLDNAAYGDLKFLYVSPERLATDMFRLRLPRMKVNLLAVDEAHCISQWGYDFRPSYLNIAEIRPMLPGVPVLALTATATPEVVEDIMKKLRFSKANVLRKSFYRLNLIYNVLNEEDKYNRLLKLCLEYKGTAIVYVRNRKKCREIAGFLNKNKISAHYYHAGLDQPTRDARQDDWLKNRVRIMVATNAFGMGIDKPDVRLVVHMDLPDCLEAYFQEAGRAGRDEKPAQAWLLCSATDILDAQRFSELSYPPVEFISKVYNALADNFQISPGYGENMSFEFDLISFLAAAALPAMETFNALKILENEGYLALSDAMRNPSRIRIIIDKDNLYKFQLENPAFDALIQTLLRSYTGLFSEFTRIDEWTIARRMNVDFEKIKIALKALDSFGILSYIPASDMPRLTFLKARLMQNDLLVSADHYWNRKADALKRLERMINFVTNHTRCRSQQLLAYFGETAPKRCGYCDVCLQRNNVDLSELEFDQVVEVIKPMLKESAYSPRELVALFPTIDARKVFRAIGWLLDNDKVIRNEDDKLEWKT